MIYWICWHGMRSSPVQSPRPQNTLSTWPISKRLIFAICEISDDFDFFYIVTSICTRMLLFVFCNVITFCIFSPFPPCSCPFFSYSGYQISNMSCHLLLLRLALGRADRLFSSYLNEDFPNVLCAVLCSAVLVACMLVMLGKGDKCCVPRRPSNRSPRVLRATVGWMHDMSVDSGTSTASTTNRCFLEILGFHISWVFVRPPDASLGQVKYC